VVLSLGVHPERCVCRGCENLTYIKLLNPHTSTKSIMMNDWTVSIVDGFSEV